MSVKYIPEGFHTVTPFILVKGVAKMSEFLKKAFNASEHRNLALPDGTVINSEIKIGDSIIMLSEARGNFPPSPVSMYLYVSNTDDTYSQAIAAGGTSVMEPSDQFYGDRNAGIKDPFNNIWWIATHNEDISDEEMHKRAAENRG